MFLYCIICVYSYCILRKYCGSWLKGVLDILFYVKLYMKYIFGLLFDVFCIILLVGVFNSLVNMFSFN